MQNASAESIWRSVDGEQKANRNWYALLFGRRIDLGNVYVFHYATGGPGFYKIGRTDKETGERLAKLSGGSPVEPTPFRNIETEVPLLLERYIQELLGTRRVHKEFFRCAASGQQKRRGVTEQQLDDAISKALTFVATCGPVISAANELRERLRRQKPDKSAQLMKPTPETLGVYRRLRKLNRKKFLLEKDIEFLQGNLLIAIGENRGIEGIASWTWAKRLVIDVDQLTGDDKTTYEALFEKYKSDSSHRKFCVEKAGII